MEHQEVVVVFFTTLLAKIFGLASNNFPTSEVKVSSFTYGDKRINVWGPTLDSSEIPFLLHYEPLFVLETEENGPVVSSRPYGSDWLTDFIVALDTDLARKSAYQKVKQIYPEFHLENIYAQHVEKVKLWIPDLFSQAEGARFPNHGFTSCPNNMSCFNFTTQVDRFRVIILSPDKQTAGKVESLLRDSQMFYEADTLPRLQANGHTVFGHLDFKNSFERSKKSSEEEKKILARVEELELQMMMMKEQQKSALPLTDELNSFVRNRTDELGNSISTLNDEMRKFNNNFLVRIRTSESSLQKKLQRVEELLNPHCPNGWKQFTTPKGLRKCFLIGSNPTSHEEAEEWCRELNVTMIEIESISENNFLKQYINELGYTGIFLGAKLNANKTFVWQTGQLVNFFNWFDGEPNDMEGIEKCVQLWNSGLWNDVPCNRNKTDLYSFYPGCQTVLVPGF